MEKHIIYMNWKKSGTRIIYIYIYIFALYIYIYIQHILVIDN